jgi:hypothetical protein
MKRRNNNFLQQLQRRREMDTRTPPGTPPSPPATETMTDEQLDAALAKAKRDLLDAQHAQLREVLTREASQGGGASPAGASSLAAVLGNLKRASRRRRRRG